VLRRIAPLLLSLAVVAGCGSSAKQSDRTARETSASQATTTTAAKPKPQRPGIPGYIHIKTRLGSFTFKLDPAASPNATRSFVHLTRTGFFNGLIFHRVVPNFVIQGGDPNGNGTGGPGYTTHDVVPPTTQYPLGTVAMAKAGNEPSGTAGSQFFVVTGRGVAFDGPYYAVIGHVTAGMKTVLRIGRQPTDQASAPLRKIVMRRVTYTRR
jgi:cyclophilin family peptidyl-prolyl cis-trans isomerase